MPGHLTRRIAHAATQPLVRNAGPAVAKAAQDFLQFLGFLAIGCTVLLVAAIAGANEIPWHVIKSAAMILGLIPMTFGLLVFIEQVRTTYEKQEPTVYPDVEPFEQRRPPIDE